MDARHVDVKTAENYSLHFRMNYVKGLTPDAKVWRYNLVQERAKLQPETGKVI